MKVSSAEAEGTICSVAFPERRLGFTAGDKRMVDVDISRRPCATPAPPRTIGRFQEALSGCAARNHLYSSGHEDRDLQADGKELGSRTTSGGLGTAAQRRRR